MFVLMRSRWHKFETYKIELRACSNDLLKKYQLDKKNIDTKLTNNTLNVHKRMFNTRYKDSAKMLFKTFYFNKQIS